MVSVLETFPLLLGAWDGLRYFILALPWPAIYLFCNLALNGQTVLEMFENNDLLQVYEKPNSLPRIFFSKKNPIQNCFWTERV